jgi:KipI family sensor histidine kinase inhibitor
MFRPSANGMVARVRANGGVFDYRILSAGDTAIVVEFGDDIDRDLNAIVLALSGRLEEAHIPGLTETIPTFRSLMLFYEPELLSRATLEGRIAGIVHELTAVQRAGRMWRLPVCYDAEMAPDLSDVAALTGLTPSQVVERHSGVLYHVYMLGFLPGLAYMGDVPRELVLPRLVSPRPRIPSGMVGIAMAMSLIMPRETPSGLNLIGRSPVAMWRQSKPSGSGRPLLTPGDQVIYQPVSPREYEVLAIKAAAGELELEPERAGPQIGSAG